MDNRERAEREASPTGSVMDTRAAHSSGVGVDGQRGCDPVRPVGGRKCCALTDTDGRLLIAAIPPANLNYSYRGVALLCTSPEL